MTRALVAVLFVVVAELAAGAGLAGDQRLAILDVDGGALKSAELAKAQAALRAGAESALVDPRITIVDVKAQKAALKRARPCTQGPTMCARDAGKAIGATLVLAGRVAKAGKRTVSSLWLVDVDTGLVLAEDTVDAAAPKEAAASLQRRTASVVSAGLRAKEPKPPTAPPPSVEPPAPKDDFSRRFSAALVGPQGAVEGTLTLTPQKLSFEPSSTKGLQAWEELPLKEVVRLERFNHMMMLPTGIAVVTTTGKTVKFVFADDRDRTLQLLQTRLDMARGPATPKPASGG